MVQALIKKAVETETAKRLVFCYLAKMKKKEIYDFISSESKKNFERFNLPTKFLSVDPQEWARKMKIIKAVLQSFVIQKLSMTALNAQSS